MGLRPFIRDPLNLIRLIPAKGTSETAATGQCQVSPSRLLFLQRHSRQANFSFNYEVCYVYSCVIPS